MGCVIFALAQKCSALPVTSSSKLARTIAAFLGKQMES